MADPKPVFHRLVVPRGWENREDVLAAYERLVQRHGESNVELIVEDRPRDPHADDPPDFSPSHVFRVPPDPDE